MAYEELSNDSKLVNYSRYDESIVPHVMQVGLRISCAIATGISSGLTATEVNANFKPIIRTVTGTVA